MSDNNTMLTYYFTFYRMLLSKDEKNNFFVALYKQQGEIIVLAIFN